MKTIFPDIRSSVQFLSRLPVWPSDDSAAEPDFSQSAWAFPIAGVIIAIPGALALWGTLAAGLPDIVSVLLAFLTLLLTTGALHEDGLADVADGFYGGHTLADKLKIMRDSQIGTYGALALLFAVGIKSTSLAGITQTVPGWTSALLFLCVASLSRTAMLYPWYTLPAARAPQKKSAKSKGKNPSSLSERYGAPDLNSYIKSALVSLPVLALMGFLCGFWPMVAALLMLKVTAFAFTQLCKKQIGGRTGDTLGATQQISELGLLLGLAAFM